MRRVNAGQQSFASWPGPFDCHLSTLPLTKVTLLTAPCPSLSCLPTICCQTWLFLPGILTLESPYTSLFHFICRVSAQCSHNILTWILTIVQTSCPSQQMWYSLFPDALLYLPWQESEGSGVPSSVSLTPYTDTHILAFIWNSTARSCLACGPLWSSDHFCCYCSSLHGIPWIPTLHSYFLNLRLFSHFGLNQRSWQILYFDTDFAGEGRKHRGIFLSLTWSTTPNRLRDVCFHCLCFLHLSFSTIWSFQQYDEVNVTPILQTSTLRRQHHRE